MQKITVSTAGLLPETFEKDLTDTQIICPECNGLGLKIRDFIYGNDEGRIKYPNKHFPWNNKYVGFCDNCYFGVIKLCEHCMQPYPHKMYNLCECSGATAERNALEKAKIQKYYDEAKKLTLQEAIDQGIEQVYFDTGDKYIAIDEIGDHFCNEQSDDPDYILPKWLFGTWTAYMKIDIDNIIEDCCSDLHEDASERVDGRKEMQKVLDKWLEDNKHNTLTYYMDYKVVVLLPEDIYGGTQWNTEKN